MIALPAALQAFLLSGLPFWCAELYTVTLRSGVVYYWTSFNLDVAANGHSFSSTGPGLTRKSWSRKNTSQVPELQINVIAGTADFNGGNLKQQLHNGLFAGARVRLDRAYMPAPLDVSLGTAIIFEGRSSKIALTATGADLTVKGDNVLFNQYMPRNLYQPGCIHTTYDPGCGLSQAANTIANTVGATSGGPTASFIPWGAAPPNPGAYAPNGILIMLSGNAAQQQRAIKSADATGITLIYPLYNVPAVGDTFSVAKGDDKTLATCTARFNSDNHQHWRGFKFIPPAETAI